MTRLIVLLAQTIMSVGSKGIVVQHATIARGIHVLHPRFTPTFFIREIGTKLNHEKSFAELKYGSENKYLVCFVYLLLVQAAISLLNRLAGSQFALVVSGFWRDASSTCLIVFLAQANISVGSKAFGGSSATRHVKPRVTLT